jgi:hypothetical protein
LLQTRVYGALWQNRNRLGPHELLFHGESDTARERDAFVVLLYSMSGRIQRAVGEIFDRERDNAFTTEDLCERIWPHLNWFKKHQRNTVLRAVRVIASQRPEIQWLYNQRLGGTVVFFRHDEVMSYAMARLKADRFQRYRIPRLSWSSEADLRRELDTESYRKLIGPGGAWRRQVEIFLARSAELPVDRA